MKHVYFTSIAAMVFACNFGLAQTWWPQNSNTSSDLNEIFYVSNNVGWTFGDSTDILGGYASGVELKSVNQGFTYNKVDMGSPIYQIMGSYFHNTSIGFAVGRNKLSGNGLIISTVDGGASWTEFSPLPERLADIHFSDVNNGWTVGRNDFVMRTTDGGTNWVDISTNAGDHLEGVFFTTNTNGYIVGRAGIIISTTDGGNNWNYLNSNSQRDLNAVYFVNDSTGWVVGTAGEILFTNNWGLSWNAQNSGTQEDLNDVSFVNDTTGWAVGTAGTVLKTIDAGANWIPEVSGTTEDITSLTMRNESLGWYCGLNGTIFIYGIDPPNSVQKIDGNLNVQIYPNPTSSTTTISLPDNKEYSFVLSNAQGEAVKVWNTSGNNNVKIDCQTLIQGIYFLQIQDENKMSAVQKIVINK